MVSINSDMGEALGNHSFGNDDDLLDIIDLANVACGFHSGDPVTMRQTVNNAVAAGVAVGAHPGLPDLVGFGRREMVLTPDEAKDLVLYQVGALVAFVADAGAQLQHIKPHGALYGMTARDEAVMGAICDVAEAYGVPVLGLAGTAHESVARRRGVEFIAELYVDLAYREDGSLIIRRAPVPVVPTDAADRVRTALSSGTITAETGQVIPVRFDSICVHSDTTNAPAIAASVREVLQQAHSLGTARSSGVRDQS